MTALSVVIVAVAFLLFYVPAVKRLSRGLASPYAKADVGKRVSAAMIDGLLLVTAWFLYQRSDSMAALIAGAAYLLMRDAMHGRSFGKFLFGLVVISLETGKPCTRTTAVRRNLVFLVPGANVVAVFLEAVTILKDPQGQRLGDRMAQTQVVEGFGVRDVAPALERWWQSVFGEIHDGVRPPVRLPQKVA
jgi:uncharacterized RDD family membrane protein YckC